MNLRLKIQAVTLVAFILGVTGPASAAPPPPAIDDHSVLILDTTVIGGAASLEAVTAAAQGFTVDVVDAATWGAMSAADFASYRAIILGDPQCVEDTAPLIAAETNRTVWGPEIDGNIIIIGTDPEFHSTFGPGGAQGGDVVTDNGIAFAAALEGKTGAYITLSCYYAFAIPSTPVPVLDQFGGGVFTVVGQFSPSFTEDAHILSTDFALGTLTDDILSNWGQSVHEAFDSFDSSFEPLAISLGFTGTGSLTFPDGSIGIPYILTAGATTAVVAPDGDNPVKAFSSAFNPNNDNPLNMTFKKLKTGGTVTVDCCTISARRELERAPKCKGKNKCYQPRELDIGEELLRSVAGATPYDESCAALIPFIGVGDATLRPSIRALPDPAIVVDYSDPASIETADLKHGVCLIRSAPESVGVTFFEEEAAKVVDFSLDCGPIEEGRVLPVDFRGFTAAISLDPTELNLGIIEPMTAECDGSRSGKRSSDIAILVNERLDTKLLSAKATVHRLGGSIEDEIKEEQFQVSQEASPDLVYLGQLADLLAKLGQGQKEINLALKATRRKEQSDAGFVEAFDTAIGKMDEFTCQALSLKERENNFGGLATGRGMNWKYMACSYLQHPDSILFEDCPIDEKIENTILNLSGDKCPIGP